MDQYNEVMDSIGDTLIEWADSTGKWKANAVRIYMLTHGDSPNTDLLPIVDAVDIIASVRHILKHLPNLTHDAISWSSIGLVPMRFPFRRHHSPHLPDIRHCRSSCHELPSSLRSLSHQIHLQCLTNFPLCLHDHRSWDDCPPFRLHLLNTLQYL